MTQKKRVYDLAKEYGMVGQELAAKLRDLGFVQIKSHMTSLSETEVLEIMGRLEAYGIVGESSREARPDGPSDVAGLVIKKKQKKVKADEAPAPEPTRREPEPTPAPTPAPAETAPQAGEPDEPAPELEPELEGDEGPTDGAEPLLAEPVGAEAAELSGEAVLELPAAEEVVGEGGAIVRPAARRRQGNVVGFIDLSKLPQQKKPDARRLKATEENVPEVMPTLGRDRRRGITRADAGARAQLTQQQLRERESSRFLRNRRPPTTGAAGPGGAIRRGPRTADASGSPYSGNQVAVAGPVTVRKLADALSIRAQDLLKTCIRLLGFGTITNLNALLDEDTAVLLAGEYQVDLQVTREVEAEEQLIASLEQKRADVEESDLETRAPVIAFLGHVDHGKTTLIDTIRRSAIAKSESGGITQHIGAYQVTTKTGHLLTILDTPGHAAFTAMRARGARAVDMVVLVVAADDGVMPQTEEAFNHARAANVLIVVAVNKVDKPEANLEKVRNGLSTLGLIPEEWGGSTAMLPVSGLKGTGVDELLERVFLESEVLELKCHASGPARGVVLEAKVEQGKGRIAHLLVQDGCLRRGDIILAGEGYGKVRAITNDRGQDLAQAGPSTPVEVTGLNELPGVGDHFHVVQALDQAKEVAEERARKNRQMSLAERRSVSAENLLEAVAEQGKNTIPIIVKTDVLGSLEVLRAQIGAQTHAELELRLIDSGVGQVSESDVDLAITSGATVFAFHVGTNGKARLAAERAGIEIRYHEVIYEMLDEIRVLMEGVLSPEVKEVITGHAEIRAIFKSSKLGNIAGCYVLDGALQRDNKSRLLRDGKVVHSGEIGSLRREKDDVREVREGFECGITLRNFDDIKEGDVIEGYKLVESRRRL